MVLTISMTSFEIAIWRRARRLESRPGRLMDGQKPSTTLVRTLFMTWWEHHKRSSCTNSCSLFFPLLVRLIERMEANILLPMDFSSLK